MALPELGSITDSEFSHLEVVSHLSDLARESAGNRDKWAQQADKNSTTYLTGEYPEPTADKRVINLIQNAILADVVIQTREKIAVTLKPVETGDPGEIYYADPSMYGMMPPTPIDPKMAQMMQMPQPTGMIDPMSGQEALAPGAPPETFITVDDKLTSEVWQAVFDRFWKRSKVDGWIKRTLISSEVHGWAVALYEWDEQTKKHRLRPMSVWQAYLDPTEETIDDSAYVGIDIVIDADEAAKIYPQIADRIRELARDGTPTRPDENTDLGRADMDYERKVVTLRVFWLRNQTMPMGEQEAIASGLVVEGMVEDVIETGPTGVPGEAVEQDAGAEVGPVGPGVSGMDEGISGDAGGLGEQVPQLALPLLRPALLLADTGAEVVPGSPGWPTRLGIRQVTVIESIVVDDGECEHYDVPILHHVNRPIPGRPWGIGEPQFLMAHQKAYNTLMDGMVAYSEYYKNPMHMMPQSAAELLEKATGKAYVKPGVTVILPDDIWQMFGGKPDMFHSPPPMADGPLQMSQLLKQDITEQSGHSDVLRGIMPSAQTSGKAIERLQDSGTQMIQHKSQSTEAMVEKLAHLMHFTHVWRLEISDIRQIISRYPDYVLEAIIRKAKISEFDIDVVLSSGTGAVLASKKQEEVQKFQIRDTITGEPLQGIETTREMLSIDHSQERQRWDQQQAETALKQAMNPQDGQENKNGNPKSNSGSGQVTAR